VGDPTVEAAGVVAATERRMVRMLAYIRAGTAGFVYIPLIGWQKLAIPAIALLTALAATVHSLWFVRRAFRTEKLRDPVLVWADVAFSIALMIIGSRAAWDMDRNTLMTPLLPYSLVTSAVLGFGLGWARAPILAVAGLTVVWVAAIFPDHGQKLGSDILGFTTWYVVAFLIGREILGLAHQADEARQRAERSQRLLAERAIHDDLLPVIERVAAGGELGEQVSKAARRAAIRARRFIGDDRDVPVQAFEARLDEVCEAAVHLGMRVTRIFRIGADPPDEVAETLAVAVGEALNNVRRHTGPGVKTHVYAESDESGVYVTVLDDGCGFDPDRVTPGLGFSGAYAALRHAGGDCSINSLPGSGTKVTLRWPSGREA
jgi:signal transduction histidine kinase